jgi:hypothetical protein
MENSSGQSAKVSIFQESASNKILDLLQSEYQRACGEVERLLVQNEKVVHITALFLGGLAYVAFKDNVTALLALVPIGFAALFLYIANVHEFAMISRGYAASIEATISKLLGAPVLNWETKHARVVNHYRGSTIALMLVGLAVALTSSCFAVSQLWAGDHGCLVFADCLIFLSGCGYGFWRLSRLGELHASVRQRCLDEVGTWLTVQTLPAQAGENYSTPKNPSDGKISTENIARTE